jgi:hypothetical protein
VPLLQALTGHCSIRELQFCDDPDEHGAELGVPPEHVPAVADALAALVGANAPALRVLHLHGLSSHVLAPLFGALQHNTHLRELDVRGTEFRAQYVDDVIVPAAHANASLHALRCFWFDDDEPSPEELQAVARVDALTARNAARHAAGEQ